MGLMDSLRAKVELYRLEQRYARRDKRTTYAAQAQYVDGEYIFAEPSHSSTSSSRGSGSTFSSGPSKRITGIKVKEMVPGKGTRV